MYPSSKIKVKKVLLPLLLSINTMKKSITFLLAFSFFLIVCSFNKASVIPDFNLRNVNGKFVSTKDYTNAKGFIIIFTCNHCPFAKLYSKRMNDLSNKYAKLNVPLIAINSMDTLLYEDETFPLMQKKAMKDKFNFPYVQDATQEVGKQFGAEHTPMAFVIWKENNGYVIKYKGAIDDNGEHPTLAKPYIANAVNELLNNKKVSLPISESFGCRIFYRKK